MLRSRIKIAFLVCLLGTLGTIGPVSAQTFTPPSQVTVWMYRLDPATGAKWYPEELCSTDNTEFGCTAFVDDDNHSYPYANNPATVSIEYDYLLDVVPGSVPIKCW